MLQARQLADAALTALFPPACGACAETLAVRPQFGLCDRCTEILTPNDGPRCETCDDPGDARCPRCTQAPPAFSRARAPYLYGGPLADALVAAKFRRREDLAGALGELLAHNDEARALAQGATALVPVPLGPNRRRRRGYNQSAILARRLGRAWSLPVVHALVRTRNTAPQSDLDRAQRRKNVAGAFAHRLDSSGIVVLVDDVVTSGETARQAAGALKSAGASEVRVLALMRRTL